MSGPEKESAFRPKARRPRGFQDRRGPALAAERDLVEKISKVYESWGFERLETPAFEYADALGKFLPDQDRPNEGVFALGDDDSQWMALRYDLTAPLARFVAENFDALPKPYRRWAAGPVWRNEKPGPGRYREFWQCDADTVGSASPAADAEMIAMACEALEAVGVKRGQYRINVSSRNILNGMLDASGIATGDYAKRLKVLRALDKLDRLGFDGVRELLGLGRMDDSGDFTPGAELSADAMDKVLAFADAGKRPTRARTLIALANAVSGFAQGEAGHTELCSIDKVLTELGVNDAQVRFDPAVVRGLEYYTGPVYEAELLTETIDEKGNTIRFGSVGGGGRYDDLVARFTGQLVPATGFSVGVSRLVAALEAAKQGEAVTEAPVVVLALDQTRMGEYFAMAAELRSAGLRAEVYLGSGGMKAQLKYADKRGACVAVIRGGDELARGTVTIKNLRLGTLYSDVAGSDRSAWNEARRLVQVEVPRERLVDNVRASLDAVR